MHKDRGAYHGHRDGRFGVIWFFRIADVRDYLLVTQHLRVCPGEPRLGHEKQGRRKQIDIGQASRLLNGRVLQC